MAKKLFKVIDEEGETEYQFQRSKTKQILNVILAVVSFGLLKVKNPYKLLPSKKKKAAVSTEELGKQRPKTLPNP